MTLALTSFGSDWSEHIRNRALDIFIGQLRRKKILLLVVYALKLCLEHGKVIKTVCG